MIKVVAQFRGRFGFLSNFYPCTVELKGTQLFPEIASHEIYSARSVEHAYQAAKSKKKSSLNKVLGAGSAGEAKKVGRGIILRPDWEFVKLDIMRSLIESKFSERRLGKALVDTAPHVLIEGNNWGDTFWGVCNGVGYNYLGLLLMLQRNKLMDNQ